MAYDSLQVYGIAISNEVTQLQGVNIFTGVSRLQGVTIHANNFFNEDIVVQDKNGDAISGATVNIVSTQTHQSNYIGNISGTTDSNGIFSATGSSTTGTTIRIAKSGFTSYTGSLPTSLGQDGVLLISLFPAGGGSSKKVYTTNKGNVLINPNDTILIELD